MSLAQNIKRYRESKGFSQEYIGDKLGMSQSAYCRLEAQATKCARALEQIADALATTSDALRNYHETHPPDTVTDETEVLPTVPVTELLKQKEAIIQVQQEEISFLRGQIAHLQSAWSKHFGGRK